MRRPDILLATPPSSSSNSHDPAIWRTPTGTRMIAATLAFLAVVLIPVVLHSAVDRPTAPPEPAFACATIDWRVGEKLVALGKVESPHLAAIVNDVIHRREIARAQCQAGQVDDAMASYRMIDRALYRAVQHGAASAFAR